MARVNSKSDFSYFYGILFDASLDLKTSIDDICDGVCDFRLSKRDRNLLRSRLYEIKEATNKMEFFIGRMEDS